MKAQGSRGSGSSMKRRLHLLALFFCVISLFVLFVMWRLRGDYNTTNGTLDSVLTNLQGSTTQSASSPDKGPVTFDQIDSSVWQRLSSTQPVVTVTQRILEPGPPSPSIQPSAGLQSDSNEPVLPDICSDDQLLKWDLAASDWGCATDIDTDTTYGASDGLTLSGTTFALDKTTANTWTGLQTFGSGLSLNSNTYTDLAGTGLQFTGGILSSTLGTTIDSSEISDNSITAGDIVDGTLTFTKLGQNSCTADEVIKWSGTAWGCAADTDTDTNTTYSAGNGLGLSGTTFSLDLSAANNWTGLQTFNSGLSVGGGTYTNLTGTGLSLTSGTLTSVLGTGIDSSEITDGAITGPDLAANAITSGVILDGTIAAADIADGTLTLAKLGQNSCSSNQIIKWNGTNWACAADVDTDTNTTYSADSGLSLTGTTFSLTLASGSGLALSGGALTLLNTCASGQYLSWNGASWGCTSTVMPTIFQVVAGDSGSATADAASDTITLVGGSGLTSTAADTPDTITFNIDLASGSGLGFSSGALTLQSCTDGQLLKRVSGAWACAADNTDLLTAAYKQQLAGSDNVTITSSLTPLLTNGSGTAQSLGITVSSGNEVSYIATIQATTTLATGAVNYVVIRDDNHDNDCGTGGGDGTQIGGQVASFLGSITQSFTTTIAFSDTSPSAGTTYYQLCASTGILSGTTSATNRSLKLDEVNL